ncbi:MAG: GntR family transcriptional regulator [Pelagimonas sp.]|nr:GntR family transcriptional regulator [Pelagimonas sp.]
MLDQQNKKSDHLAQILSERILRGAPAPDEKLRQDAVAREFGVSQVTVREAFLQLVSQGLAISLPRRGFCVAPLDQGAIDELQVMRLALEPVALQHSVPRLTPPQITQIEALHDACDAAETATAWEEHNRAFHNAIIAGCAMPRLIAEIANLQLLNGRHFHSRQAVRWRKRADPDHAAILSAIRDRDADRARSVMKRHLTRHF